MSGKIHTEMDQARIDDNEWTVMPSIMKNPNTSTLIT